MIKSISETIAHMNKKAGRNLVKDFVIGAIAIVTFLVVWQLVSSSLNIDYVPSPGDVWTAFVESFEKKDPNMGITMWQNIISSVNRFLTGFVLSLILAVPIGLLIGSSSTAESFAKPLIEIFRPIPPIAWVPFLLIVVGQIWGPIIVIIMGVFFPVLSNVIFGVRSVEPQLIDAAKTLGAKRSAIFTKVIFPYTIPYLMAGITIGLGIGWMCIVAAEMIGAQGGGIGLYIQIQASVGRWDYMFAGMVVIALLGILTVGGATYLEKKITKWMGVSRK